MNDPNRGTDLSAARLRKLMKGRRLVVIGAEGAFPADSGGRSLPDGTRLALTEAVERCDGVWLVPVPRGERVRYEVRPVHPVALDASDAAGWCEGFHAGALEPLFHYALDRCRFSDDHWRAYAEVNETFAEAAGEVTGSGDLVWVDGTLFCLVPDLVRRRRRSWGPIVVTLGSPLPDPEMLKVLPRRGEVLSGLLGADLVVTGDERSARNLLAACERLLGTVVDRAAGSVEWQGRRVRVEHSDIGVDRAAWEELATAPEVLSRSVRLRSHLGVERVALAVDPFTPQRGILERLDAVDRLFAERPELAGRALFVQIAVPSERESAEERELREKVEARVGRINGEHHRPGWNPVLYLHRSLESDEELAAFFRAADVLVATPLMEGSAVLAREYCASRLDGDGVLLLSELTGDAAAFADAALLVNPFCQVDMMHRLGEALGLAREERRRRMARLRAGVAAVDARRRVLRILETAIRQAERTTELDRRRVRVRAQGSGSATHGGDTGSLYPPTPTAVRPRTKRPAAPPPVSPLGGASARSEI